MEPENLTFRSMWMHALKTGSIANNFTSCTNLVKCFLNLCILEGLYIWGTKIQPTYKGASHNSHYRYKEVLYVLIIFYYCTLVIYPYHRQKL
jgi:hypothetical protein